MDGPGSAVNRTLDGHTCLDVDRLHAGDLCAAAPTAGSADLPVRILHPGQPRGLKLI